MTIYKNKSDRRKQRVRRKLKSISSDKPRLSIFKSNAYIYVQVIDDKAAHTLAAASTKKNNVASATELGTVIAKKALEKGLKDVVFDRGGYKYHGKTKALVEAARDAGLDV